MRRPMAFSRVCQRGQLKGPVSPNGSRMYHGQNSAAHNVRQTGKIHTVSFLNSLTHSNLEHVLWQPSFAGHTTLKYNHGDQKCGRRSEPSERATPN